MRRLPSALRTTLATLTLASLAVTSSKAVGTDAVSEHGAVLTAFARSYETRSLEGLGALLSADYRFHSSDWRVLQKYVTGLDREHELESASGMFVGWRHGDSVLVAPADSIAVMFSDVSENDDPEHPDSTAQYRVLAVGRLAFRIRRGNDVLMPLPAQHVFHVVRGDAAVLAPGQTASTHRWYIRRWLEDVSGVNEALANRTGDCGPQAHPVTATPRPGSGVLALRPLGNPACPAMEVMCDVPGSEVLQVEVFDVTGRLANRREIAVKAPGAIKIEAGAGAHIEPGVYWVRLRQASRRPTTSMVVVAR